MKHVQACFIRPVTILLHNKKKSCPVAVCNTTLITQQRLIGEEQELVFSFGGFSLNK